MSASTLVSPSSVPLVSSICLSAAAVKAKELSLDEERKLLRCMAQLVQAQMRRVEIKLNHIQQLDSYLLQRHQDVHAHYTTLVQQQLHAMQQTQQQLQQDATDSSATQPTAQRGDAGKEDAEQGGSGAGRGASTASTSPSEPLSHPLSSSSSPAGIAASSDSAPSIPTADGASSVVTA